MAYEAEGTRPCGKSLPEFAVCDTSSVVNVIKGCIDQPDEDFDFVEKPSDELHCSICLSVLSNPNLTSCCGNHFCQGCIKRIRSDGKPCPLCQCKEFQVFLDKSVQRRVMQLKVHCSNKGKGCKWVGELREIEKHLKCFCELVLVPCSFQCGTEVPRCHLVDHTENTCPNRPYSCTYCGLQATYGVVLEHRSQCEAYPVECPNGCGADSIMCKALTAHVEICPLEVIECEFGLAGCGVKTPRREMPQHMAEGVSSHVTLIPKICSKLEEKDKAMADLVAKLEQKLTLQDKKMASQDEQMTRLHATIRVQQREIERLNTVLQDTAKTVHLHSLPPLHFVMTDFEAHYNDGDQWFSPAFYTHERGYKMCLSVFAYGIGKARGSHVSVFANLMKGEFDDELAWPFCGNVDVDVLVNAAHDDIYSETLEFTRSSPAKAAGRVSYGDRNDFGQGWSKFIPHYKLNIRKIPLLLFRINCVNVDSPVLYVC